MKQMSFDAALTNLILRQFKTQMKKMAAQVDFCLLAIRCLKIGIFVFINVVLTYTGQPGQSPNYAVITRSRLDMA